MHIAFNPSPAPTIGIEVELEIVDLASGELVSVASELLAELGAGHPGGEHPKAKHELLECTVEVITGICRTVGEARADLETTIAELSAATDARGLAPICSGSHPFSRWAEQQISPDPRYAALVDEMQWLARRMQIFGVHVHVGVPSAEASIAITNALATYVPHVLALSGSSPFWEGVDTGLDSCRSKVFEGLPTTGLPADLGGWADFESLMGTLVASGSITTIREVWWDIRPHPDFGTVELRVADGIPTMAEITAVAALAQCLIVELGDRLDAGEPLPRQPGWLLGQNKWRAVRHGLDAELVVDAEGDTVPAREAIHALVQRLTPTAQRLGCETELASVLDILRTGNSATRQRAVAASADGDLRPVVASLVDELRTGRPDGWPT